MKNRNEAKVRSTAIIGHTRNRVDSIQIEYDSESDTFNFGDDLSDVHVEESYERRKGKKVVSRVPQPSTSATFKHAKSISNNFDILIAVDTNTKTIHYNEVSYTGITQAHQAYVCDVNGGIELFWQYFTPLCYEITNAKVNPEKLGWIHCIQYVEATKRLAKHKKVGLVTDYDLGNHNRYNEREAPILGRIYLPSRYTLIYASSDVGQDQFANTLIRCADKASNQCFAALMSGELTCSENDERSPYYDSIRKIYSADHANTA